MITLLLVLLLASLASYCHGYINVIDSIIAPMRVSLLRTLQLDKEEYQQQQQQLQHDNDNGLNTRQKRLLSIYKKNINDKNTMFGFTTSSELVNGRIAMVSFLICFFIEDITNESILEQIGLLEHNFHVSFYMLISALTIQPILSFFSDDNDTKK